MLRGSNEDYERKMKMTAPRKTFYFPIGQISERYIGIVIARHEIMSDHFKGIFVVVFHNLACI